MSTTTIVLMIIAAVCGVIIALWQYRLRRVHLETVARDSVLTDKEVEEAATILFKGLAENAREPNTLYDLRPWLSENSHHTRVDLTRILLSLSQRGRLRIVRPVLDEINEISFSGNWTPLVYARVCPAHFKRLGGDRKHNSCKTCTSNHYSQKEDSGQIHEVRRQEYRRERQREEQ